MARYIDFDQTSLYVSAASIAFNPVFWNIVARKEYRSKSLTRLLGGNSHRACYVLAATIFSLGIVRDVLFERALRHQPSAAMIPASLDPLMAYILILGGNILVLSSMWALGITGTFLGDYFGILMDHRVTSFPFNLMGAPMYYGSTLNFLGSTLLYRRPAGLVLTAEVLVVYLTALRFEDPFTAQIYKNREQSDVRKRS